MADSFINVCVTPLQDDVYNYLKQTRDAPPPILNGFLVSDEYDQLITDDGDNYIIDVPDGGGYLLFDDNSIAASDDNDSFIPDYSQNTLFYTQNGDYLQTNDGLPLIIQSP